MHVAPTNLDKLRERATYDLDTWAGLLMPAIAIYEFPPFYKELWVICIRSFLDLNPLDKVFKLLLVLPRGHAKTTFVKLLVVYGIVHQLFDFVLIVCATDNNATNFMDDVCAMLSHHNVRQLYGDWEAGLLQDNAEEKTSMFMGRRAQIKAASVLSGSIRGTQKDMRRPDAIICDDIQTKEDADSKPKSDKKAATLIGTVFKSKSPHRCGIIYMGNSYPRNCIADKLQKSGEFLTLKTGGILANGEALWPELHSLHSLRAEWKLDCALGMGHVFMAEVQNQPLESDGLQPLFPDGDFPLTLLHDTGLETIGAFVTIDPAGRKRTSNDTAIAGHLIYEDHTFELAHLEAEILDPAQTIKRAIAIAEQIGAPYVFVESVGYQETLAFWANEIIKTMRLERHIEFRPLGVGTSAKLARIRAWVGELLAGKYVISSPDVKASILFQGLQFDATRTDNRDDKLDVAAHGTLVRNNALLLDEILYAYRMQQAYTLDNCPKPQTVAGALASRLASSLR